MRLLPFLLWACSCANFSPVTIAREMGTLGWFALDGSKKWQPVDRSMSCAALTPLVPEGEVLVLLPGVKGDGDEISALLPALVRAKPAARLLYRWVPWDEREAITRGFATGIFQLLRCRPQIDGRLLLVAHIAGGMVVSFGATQIDVPKRERTGPAAYLMTVASPLAGMNDRKPNSDGHPEARFMLDFGTRIAAYPPAPPEIAAVHLRTQNPGDQVMQPTPLHERNDPKIGIPGARQINLPASLTHDGSLLYVAQRVADGTWREWFSRP